jgi:hypothetical protein
MNEMYLKPGGDYPLMKSTENVAFPGAVKYTSWTNVPPRGAEISAS